MPPVDDPAQFARIADRMAEELDSDASGHDVHHAWRVFRLGLDVADSEGADPDVVGAAALVHDLHRVVTDEFVHPRETLPTVREILADADYAGDVEAVCHAVAVHEEYDFDYGHGDEQGTETLEAEVLQDADNLDAMGAVGIARAFAFAGAHDNRMHDVDPSPEWVPWEDETAGEGGTIDHFRAKLLHLAENMNTERGRELAVERHAVLAEFVERFEREWRGEI